MHVKRAFFLLVFLALPLLGAACAPAVPWNEMPGNDLYGGANSSRMTANAALQQAQWQEQAMTATAQSGIVPMTLTAAAITVEAAHAQGTSTAGASTQAAVMTSTAIWWTPTPNMTGTLDALAISAAQTQTTLNLQQAQANNDFKAHLPVYSFAVLILVLAIVLMLITRRWRYQPAKVDARGNVLPILDVVDGSFTDIDRSPNFKGSVSNDLLARILARWVEKKFGVTALLPEIDAKRQDATTERDQMIDLATRGLPGPSSETKEMKKLAGQQMVKQLTDTNLESRFRILDGSANHLDVIDGQIVQVLDEEWKEAVKK